MSFACDRRVDVVGTHATPQNIRQGNTYAATTHLRSDNATAAQVRSPSAVRTQYIRHDTPQKQNIRHSYAPDTLWIRKERRRKAVTMLYTPYVRNSYTSCIPMTYPAITLRSHCVPAALFSLLRRTCDVCMAYQSCYVRAAIFKCGLKKSPHPGVPGDRAAYQIRKLSLLWRSFLTATYPDTPYARKLIRQCVKAV